MDIVSTDLLHQFQINDKQSASSQRNYFIVSAIWSLFTWRHSSHIGVPKQWKGGNNPVEAELFSYVNSFFCSDKFAWLLFTWVKTLYGTAISLESLTEAGYLPHSCDFWGWKAYLHFLPCRLVQLLTGTHPLRYQFRSCPLKNITTKAQNFSSTTTIVFKITLVRCQKQITICL